MARSKHPEVTIQRILDVSTNLFVEKGYEETTIQDIVDALGDLSKGAIYHHFKSKEEIIEAVGERLHQDVDFRTMFDGQNMTGCEKIKQMVLFCLRSAEQQQLMKAAPTIMNNPKFLAMEVFESVDEYSYVIGSYIEAGNQDGSMNVKYPQEAAEILMLLANVWINPLVFPVEMEKFERKMLCFKEVLDGIGIPVMDDEVIQALLEMKRNID